MRFWVEHHPGPRDWHWEVWREGDDFPHALTHATRAGAEAAARKLADETRGGVFLSWEDVPTMTVEEVPEVTVPEVVKVAPRSKKRLPRKKKRRI